MECKSSDWSPLSALGSHWGIGNKTRWAHGFSPKSSECANEGDGALLCMSPVFITFSLLMQPDLAFVQQQQDRSSRLRSRSCGLILLRQWERGGLFSPQSLVSASCRVETYLDRLHTMNTVTVWLCAACQWRQLISYEASHCKGPMYILNWVKGDPVTVWVTALTLQSIHWLFGPSVNSIFVSFCFTTFRLCTQGWWFMSWSGWILQSVSCKC